MDLRGHLARALESGRFRHSPLAEAGARAYAQFAAPRVARPLAFADGAYVLAVGGATLGGSGRTPLALECARVLAENGEKVCLVGHAYAAAPERARVVSPGDPLALVGDEALLAARALADLPGARVVVAPRRQEALTYALRHAGRVVLDGVLQTAPQRATLALLAVMADAPWGSGACPPVGDLRAPASSLFAACDAVVALGSEGPDRAGGHRLPGAPAAFAARVSSCGASFGGQTIHWKALQRQRVGLLTSLSRPSRLLESLAREGISPLAVVSSADHRSPSLGTLARTRALGARLRIDLWLASPKCALHLEEPGRPGCFVLPLAVLEHRLSLEPSLVDRLCRAMCVGGR